MVNESVGDPKMYYRHDIRACVCCYFCVCCWHQMMISKQASWSSNSLPLWKKKYLRQTIDMLGTLRELGNWRGRGEKLSFPASVLPSFSSLPISAKDIRNKKLLENWDNKVSDTYRDATATIFHFRLTCQCTQPAARNFDGVKLCDKIKQCTTSRIHKFRLRRILSPVSFTSCYNWFQCNLRP